MTDLSNSLAHAFATTRNERPIGCCRVYVVLANKADAKRVAAAAKKIGKIFQAKAHYGLKNALYIGYDNCSGRELAQGTDVMLALKNEEGD